MYIANKDFHSPFTGLIVLKGQAVLVPATEREGDTFKGLLADGTIRDSDTAIGPYGNAGTEGVHDRSQLTENDLPGKTPVSTEPQRFHDGSLENAMANRAEQARMQAQTAEQADQAKRDAVAKAAADANAQADANKAVSDPAFAAKAKK